MKTKTSAEEKVGKACQAAADRWDLSTALANGATPLPYIPASSHTTAWLGPLLGSGKFCEVREVKDKKTNDPIAVKELSPFIKKGSPVQLQSASVDLVMEAKLLNSLQHENIIQLHGVSTRQANLSTCFVNGKYFRIYLERLSSTLDVKLKKWRSCGDAERTTGLEMRVASVALPTARAMSYLHSNNIIFRDLKVGRSDFCSYCIVRVEILTPLRPQPQNIGFAQDGTLKLFDFGLASELSSQEVQGHHLGTPEYMAPEAGSLDCGLKSDVYSFAIVLFELCTLQRAYDHLSLREWYEKVVDGNIRPRASKPLDSPDMHDLIERCWAKQPTDRPTFSAIVEKLEEQDLPDGPFSDSSDPVRASAAPLKRLAEKAVESIKSLDRSAHRAILNLSKHSLNLSRHSMNLSRHGLNLSKHGLSLSKHAVKVSLQKRADDSESDGEIEV